MCVCVCVLLLLLLCCVCVCNRFSSQSIPFYLPYNQCSIDIFYLSEEIEPSDTMTALDAVMAVDEERLRLEQQADDLNHVLTELADAIANGTEIADNKDTDKTLDEQQEEVMDALNAIYERLDALDAATAEVRARSILAGLGFTHEMQSKLTKDFSGGWRMRVSLARALFIQPMCLLLDEPTNHLDMEAVLWLEGMYARYLQVVLLMFRRQIDDFTEPLLLWHLFLSNIDYLAKWNRILLLISHSQGVYTYLIGLCLLFICCCIAHASQA